MARYRARIRHNSRLAQLHTVPATTFEGRSRSAERTDLTTRSDGIRLTVPGSTHRAFCSRHWIGRSSSPAANASLRSPCRLRRRPPFEVLRRACGGSVLMLDPRPAGRLAVGRPKIHVLRKGGCRLLATVCPSQLGLLDDRSNLEISVASQSSGAGRRLTPHDRRTAIHPA